MTKRTVASIGALSLLFGGVTTFVASPAEADTASCIAYLTQQAAQTTVRNQVCETTEAIGDAYSVEAALVYCDVAMTLTLLPQPQTQEACNRAVAP